jgi:SAM-dependent methyltransferase
MRPRAVVAAVVGAVALWGTLPIARARIRRAAANWDRCSAPSVALYDAGSSALLGGFFDLVAAEVVGRCSAGSVLEIGGGPGHLALRLARLAPGLTVAGVDIDPAMVERARMRAESAGVATRVEHVMADVSAMPYPDGSVDLVVSTFSMHHWADPIGGLTEIHRVLRPGGSALIYDLVGWIRRLETRGADPLTLVAASPFTDGRLTDVRWPGPFVIVSLLELTKPT